ncbi:hypothetical protein C9413_09130 [Rhizobium sp. SEMIA 4085]|nr:hypothetical protein [Rhizobium sp. SEMIA 4085]
MTLSTSEGDFILDDLADEIKPWHAAPQVFLRRQSHHNPIDR